MSQASKKSYIAGPSNAQAEDDLISYVERAYSLLMSANMKALRLIMTKLDKNPSEEGFTIMMGEVDGVFDHFNSQQMAIVKQSIKVFLDGGSFDMSELQRLNDEQDDLARDLELVLDSSMQEEPSNSQPSAPAAPLPGRPSQTKPTVARQENGQIHGRQRWQVH